VADQTSTFTLALRDQTSGPAATAAASLEQLKGKIDADTKALRSMQAAMSRLKAAGIGPATAEYKALSDAMKARKATIGASQAEMLKLGMSFDEVAKEAPKVTDAFGDMLGSAKKMPGPLGGIASRISALREVLGAGGLAAAAFGVALVAAAAAAVVAIASVTAALLRYGIAQADARRSEALQLEGLTTIRNRMGIAAGTAGELQSAIDRVSASSSLGRGEINGLAQGLYRAGLRGGDLSAALEGAATTTAVQGQRMGDRFRGIAIAAARSGRSVRALADDVRARLGGVARRQMLSLETQSTKLQESFAAIFSGLEIEGFLGGLHSITDLFSQNTESGRALRTLATTIFQPMIDGITAGFPLVRRFFQGMLIGVLRLTLGALRLRNWLTRTFGGGDILAGIDAQRVALQAGAIVMGAFAASVLICAAAFALLLSPFIAAVAVGWAIGEALTAAGRAVRRVIDGGRELMAWFRDADWTALGSSLATGLITGLLRGRDRLRDAVRGLAADAQRALTDALQIRSPSRVFARLGAQIPAGFAEGVDAGAPMASDAVGAMVSIPDDVPAGGAARAGSTTHVSIDGGIHVHVGEGEQQPRDLAQSIKDELARMLEGVAITMGAPA
jgi:hypothetical protein